MIDTGTAANTTSSPDYPGLHQLAFRAMGCGFDVWVSTDDADEANRALAEVRGFVDGAEAIMSRFRPESELSRLNRHSGQRVGVSNLLAEVVTEAVQAAEASDGLYDPTVLPALLAAGYDRSFESIHSRDVSVPTDRAQPGAGHWRGIEIDRERSFIRLPAGTSIDLGGIGKAWTANRAAEILSKTGPCIVSAGGDVAVRGEPYPGEGWLVAVENPLRDGQHTVTLEVRTCGVATSGIDYRKWIANGAAQHHLIDPRTGRPAETDLVSVSVMTPNVLIAERLALSAMILGSMRGFELVEGEQDAGGVLTRADGEVLFTSVMEALNARGRGQDE